MHPVSLVSTIFLSDSLPAQLEIQNELLPGNCNPVKHVQYELEVSREQKNKQLRGGD